jgi:hypothetical protein
MLMGIILSFTFAVVIFYSTSTKNDKINKNVLHHPKMLQNINNWLTNYFLRSEKCQQVGINLILIYRAHTMRKSGIYL